MKRNISALTLTAALAGSIINIPNVEATFHLMQIEQAIGGVNGDTSAQAFQLRMRSAGENAVSNGRLVVRDAGGNNPVTICDFPNDVSNSAAGDRILIATCKFLSSYSNPSGTGDFVIAIANRIPDSYLAAGSLTWERKSNGGVLWRLSWGGAGYTGSTAGETTNDGDGDFGKFASALPSADLKALQFTGLASAQSTNNAADYAVTGAAAVFTNNAGSSFTVHASAACSTTDSDGDGLCNSCDNCPNASNANQLDTDGDGLGDACDGCPNDANKTAPGQCGCGMAETDSDHDGTADCIDTCTDTDGDGFGDPGFPANTCPDDGCPNDPNKHAAGLCGCGVADTDSDGDGIPNCHDNCPSVANADQADTNGDGVGDACQQSGGGGGGGGNGGGGGGGDGGGNAACGTSCGSGAATILPVMWAGTALWRRRVRWRRP